MSEIIHHAPAVLIAAAGLLGTIGKWTQACWPLMLAAGVIMFVIGVG